MVEHKKYLYYFWLFLLCILFFYNINTNKLFNLVLKKTDDTKFLFKFTILVNKNNKLRTNLTSKLHAFQLT